MKPRTSHGFTLIEWLVTLTFITILACFAFPTFRRVVASAQQTKQISSVKNITLACQLFATENAGAFPNGNYDPILKKITGTTSAATAEACFNDLIKSKKLGVEHLFWFPQQTIQCSPSRPNENGTLTAGENCWDYIAGLTNESRATLPLCFEASDGGKGTHWTKKGGHPWKNIVVFGFVDGSASKETLTADKKIEVERGGKMINLCLPTPGSDDWPETAILAPATPAPKKTR